MESKGVVAEPLSTLHLKLQTRNPNPKPDIPNSKPEIQTLNARGACLEVLAEGDGVRTEALSTLNLEVQSDAENSS